MNSINKFETNVQLLKYKVLKEVIKKANSDENMENIYLDLPKKISPGPKAALRCCIYKERAITQERIKLALGGNKINPNVIEVIDIACDECSASGIFVTPACRGCIVHSCQQNCPANAISIIDQKAVVDKDKCIECGKCVKVCPYNAIIQYKRPCITSCKINAISMDENKRVKIDNNKCISCGACVYQCPFGAISDKSFVMETIDFLKKCENNTNYKVYAIIAPSIVSQFKYAKIEQVITGIKKLGFYQVFEAALGADITLHNELKEFNEKNIMTTSCCPSFVMNIEKYFPELKKYISSSLSPMLETASLIKKFEKNSKVVFIGPCTSKKMEYKKEEYIGIIDSVISFEELQAFFDAKDIDISSLEDTPLNNASYYGRIFAKSGGISKGIQELAKENNIKDIKPIAMNGIDECKINLLKLKLGKNENNFFEGMICEGGCINGALCLQHSNKNAIDVENYGKQAKEQTIDNSIKLFYMKS